MKKIVIYQTLCFAFIILLSVISFGQTQDKIVDWAAWRAPSAAKFEALEIVDVKVSGKSITIGNPFAADEEWLKNLTFRVKNISHRPIINIRMGVTFPETAANSLVTGFTVYNPALNENQHSNPAKVLMPEEEIDLIFTEAQYIQLQRTLSKRKDSLTLKKVEITQTVVVKFEEGSEFFCSFRRNQQ